MPNRSQIRLGRREMMMLRRCAKRPHRRSRRPSRRSRPGSSSPPTGFQSRRALRPGGNMCWRQASPWWRPSVLLATDWVRHRHLARRRHQARRRMHSRLANSISRHWQPNGRSLLLPSPRSRHWHCPRPRMRSRCRPMNKSHAILHRLEPRPSS